MLTSRILLRPCFKSRLAAHRDAYAETDPRTQSSAYAKTDEHTFPGSFVCSVAEAYESDLGANTGAE